MKAEGRPTAAGETPDRDFRQHARRNSLTVAPGPELSFKAQGRRRRLVLSDALAIAGQGLTAFAVLMLAFVVYLVAISGLAHGRDQRALVRALRTPLSFGQAPLGGEIRTGTPVAVLEIPRLDLRQVVVEGTTSRQLKRAPGHMRTSPLPGQRGNAVIAARRLAYGGPFLHLDRLRRGDRITAVTGQGKSSYAVAGARRVNASSADAIAGTRDDRLTLVTSDPVLLADRRLVVTAKRVSARLPTPAGRPSQGTREELAVHGEASASTLAPLLVWSELLLLAAAAAVWLYRGWGRWPAYVISAPVLALLVLLVFDSFAPLLPATL